MRLRHLRTLEPIAYVEPKAPPSAERKPPVIQAVLQTAGYAWWPRAGFAHPRACRASFLDETMPTLMATAQERERAAGASLDVADPYPLPARPWLYEMTAEDYERLQRALTA